MGASPSKSRVEIDAKRQAWSAAGVRPQTTRRQQYYDVPPYYYQQEPERLTRGRDDEGRNRHDERGLRRAQSTRSRSRSRQHFFDDDSDDEVGVPLHGHRREGSAHHDGRGLSRGQYGGRGISRVQSSSGHGGAGQQGYDFAPPVDHVRAQYATSRSQRGREHDSQHGIRHGSHRGSEHDSQHGSPHGSHRDSQRRSQG